MEKRKGKKVRFFLISELILKIELANTICCTHKVKNESTRVILANKPENIEVYADIPGLDLNGSTIPPDILVTLSRPDLVIINRSLKSVYLLELTCSFERNILAAHQRKSTKYIPLKSDIESEGYTCTLIPFEIGSRGHVTSINRSNILNTFIQHNINTNVRRCNKELSKISLLCSFSIFHAYQQPSWKSPPFLSP